MKNNINDFLNNLSPKAAIILGSGLAESAREMLTGCRVLSYDEIEGFPSPSVPGHAGLLLGGKLDNLPVMIFAGRFHMYEGYSAFETAFPVITAYKAGVQTLITTNAAGAINKNIPPSSVMLIRDHINFLPDNPLRNLMKVSPELYGKGTFFQDLTESYDEKLRKKVRSEIPEIKEGVLVSVLGPSYETPAEIKMYRKMGADAICMSTIPEVVMARFLKIRVMGISLIANFAAGMEKKKLSHEDVLKAGKENSQKLTLFLEKIANLI